MMTTRTRLAIAAALVLAALGCESDRMAKMAERAAERQARQSEATSELGRVAADGARQLVVASARARADADAERHSLSAGWDELHQERRELVAQLRTDSLLKSATRGGGALLVALLALAVAALALRPASPGVAEADADAELIALLMDDEQPPLASQLCPPSRSLPAPHQPDDPRGDPDL